jgi:hypothetical protein
VCSVKAGPAMLAAANLATINELLELVNSEQRPWRTRLSGYGQLCAGSRFGIRNLLPRHRPGRDT